MCLVLLLAFSGRSRGKGMVDCVSILYMPGVVDFAIEKSIYMDIFKITRLDMMKQASLRCLKTAA